jgi:glycosyltransferase involved in cell wall biosynthesis
MKVFGMLRIKNEARWIRKVIQSLLPVCELIFVMDDGSTDGTLSICREFQNVVAFPSIFGSLDEMRDKNFLLDTCCTFTDAAPDWIVHIDGDEVLTQPEALLKALQTTPNLCLSLPVFYLWDHEDQMRVDGVYGNYRRESVFRPRGAQFQATAQGGNFHCGNVPQALRPSRGYAAAPLLHYGYLHRADRKRKYDWYNANDPDNQIEDQYRHMVVGDVFPADSKFRYGGPLALKPVN